MLRILLCWATTLEANVGDMAVELEPSGQYSINFVAMQQMTAEGQSNKMASDMEEHVKQRCVIEFLHAEKIASNDTNRS